MSQKTIVNLNHNDLDALGCILHLNNKTPTVNKKYFYTNYRDLEEKVADVYDFCFMNTPDLLLITDISFSNYKHLLKKLEEIKVICPVIFIDHHAYEDGFFDEFNFPIYHDITKSATLICEKYFKTTNESLNNLSNLINIFDTWDMTSPEFRASLSLNNFFYKKTENISIDEYADIIKNDGYKLPDLKEFIKQDIETSKTKIENFRKRKLITSDGFFTVAFVDECFNEILYEEFMKHKVEFVLIANSYGITRFRFNALGKFSTQQKEEIKQKLIGTLNVGHLNAFSDKIQNSNFDKIMNRVEEVYKILAAYNNFK